MPQGGILRWKLVRNGRFVRPYLFQYRAIEEARRLQEYEWDCYRFPSELQIHNRTGQIREKDTFPRFTDPVESKG